MLALLIGAPTRGLEGVDVDLADMAALVRARGGEPVVLPRATLPAVRQALADLLGRCGRDDAVLLYLTGHGSAILNTEHDSRALTPAPERLTYFATVATDGEDACLFDLELSLWCARLAGKTRNVTAILDCCHSGTLVRGDHDSVDDTAAPMAAFLAWRAAHQDEIDALDVEAHPDVVRLAAGGINGRGIAHAHGSALTRALLAELPAARDASWVALFAGIEMHLAQAGLRQHPRLSGPVRRRPFDLTEALPPGAVPVRREHGRIVLAAGQQHGVRRGDLFLLDSDPTRVHHVDDLAPTHAVLHPRDIDMSLGTSSHDLSFRTSSTAAPDMSLGPASFAVPLHLYGHGGIALVGPREHTEPLSRALRSAGWSVDPRDRSAPLATLECSESAIVVHTDEARLVADDLPGCFAILQRLARSARLQHLGAGSLRSLGVRASWGRVRAGVLEALPPREAELADDTPVFVRLENTAAGRRFVSVFWLADDGHAALLSRSQSMGIELPPRTTHLLGARPFARAARGVLLPRRPLAPGERRHERLVIVASEHRQELWSFESSDPAGTSYRTAPGVHVEVFAFTARAAATPPS
ncbi:caspase family protein [Nannocystis bainbridge]|uniref:Caspase family protein n=1 Tax=Nannocystis bainbridge TaxID=2995303 RepID=A0ABT5EB18_9BACT|nr:caspase family protein [Nannocystis bainbridge]MDC0721981.1 caspase family protein [Nannocystis bainbridge]